MSKGRRDQHSTDTAGWPAVSVVADVVERRERPTRAGKLAGDSRRSRWRAASCARRSAASAGAAGRCRRAFAAGGTSSQRYRIVLDGTRHGCLWCQAASTSGRRARVFPALVVEPWLRLPPEERSVGTSQERPDDVSGEPAPVSDLDRQAERGQRGRADTTTASPSRDQAGFAASSTITLSDAVGGGRGPQPVGVGAEPSGSRGRWHGRARRRRARYAALRL